MDFNSNRTFGQKFPSLPPLPEKNELEPLLERAKARACRPRLKKLRPHQMGLHQLVLDVSDIASCIFIR